MSGYVDIELALCTLIAPLVGEDNVAPVRPKSFEGRLPFVLVYRYGGADDGLTDRAEIGIDVHSETRGQGWPLASAIRELLTASWHSVDGVVIDRVTTDSAPYEVPFGDEGVRRWVSEYTVTSRRPAAS